MSTEEATGKRVEDILGRLAAHSDSAAGEAAEELVRALMEFYGTGLERIVALLTDTSGRPTAQLNTLLDDDVTAGLLALHDLHPEDTAARIRRALRTAQAEEVSVQSFDETTGQLRLLDESSGCGCPSTTGAARERIEHALSCHAPEVTAVELRQPEGAGEPALLQIGTRPPATERVGADSGRTAAEGIR